MKCFLHVIPLVALLALATSACSRDDGIDAAAARRIESCALSVKVADRDGQVPRTIIEPTQVEGLRPGTGQGGEAVFMVTLNDEGARRMASYTRRNIGSYLAVLCGDEEVSVAKVMGEFSREFQVMLPDEPAP